MGNAGLADLIGRIDEELLTRVRVESIRPHDPVVVRELPAPWRLVGSGNFAAVFYHPGHADLAVKVYAPGRHGFEEEVEVYRRLGIHRGYSRCLHAGDRYLVLQRLPGTTLFDCLAGGIPIPEQVITDVDEALTYARERDLHPHDVHGRNVLVHEGRGFIADVSDFLRNGESIQWDRLKRAYYAIYVPIVRPLGLRIPYLVLNAVRILNRPFRSQT